MLETLSVLPMVLVSFMLKPKTFLADMRASRANFDAEGRCVNPNMWADGLNPDGTRKDGKPIGTLAPWTAAFK